jgi:uncharacterized protein
VLLSFRFANHRSFRGEQHLNLTPVYDSGQQDAPIPIDAVPVVGIFGANASGKSNIIGAFDYFSRMIGTSDRESEPGVGPARQPFRLDPLARLEPSSYVADLALDGTRYTYGFRLNDDEILDEWLYSYPLRKKRVVFERAGQEFSWGEESRRSGIRRLAEITAPTALFLSVSARFASRSPKDQSPDDTSESLHAVFSWLWQRIVRATPQGYPIGRISTIISRSLSDPARHAVLVDLVRAADVGLRDVVVPEATDDAEFSELSRSASTLSKDQETIRRMTRRQERLQFLHHGAIGDVMLDVPDESSGTLRLLELSARAVSVLDVGGLFLVDEIDASLHPLLTASIVRLFRSVLANTTQAQLVFTSHDATLLGTLDGEEILARDQVWFTEKNADGTSELFPLAEFKPRRQGENRTRRYLNGNYGAVPELSMHLFEAAIASRVGRDA